MSNKLRLTTKIVLISTISGYAIPSIFLILIFGVGLPEKEFPKELISIGIMICIIIAIIMGISGIFSKKSNNRDIPICIICTLLCIVFLCIVCSPKLGSAHEKDRRISCSSNLRQIYLALQQYAADYAGYYPPANGAAGLEVLRKNDYLTDYSVYLCPSTTTARGKDGQLTEENVDYVYIGGLNNKSDSNLPLMYDKAINHNAGNPKDFGNVLFADGTIKGIEGDPWTQNIKK